MAIGEVAGSTISTAFASTQLNSSQRSAQQELQSTAQTKSVGASSTDAAQSITATASTGTLNTESTEYAPRGSQIDITV